MTLNDETCLAKTPKLSVSYEKDKTIDKSWPYLTKPYQEEPETHNFESAHWL